MISACCFCAPQNDPVLVTPWSNKKLHFVDKVMNSILPWIMPLDSQVLPVGDPKISEKRGKFHKLMGGQYSKLTAGWVVTKTKAMHKDGTEVELTVNRPPEPTGQPNDSELLPVVYWVHGGGFVIGQADDDYGVSLLKKVLDKGARVAMVSVEYRLAPEHAYPKGRDDVVAGLLWLVDLAAEARAALGLQAGPVHVAGVSAGANLAAVAALEVQRQRGAAAVASLLLDCPMADPTCSGESYRRNAGTGIAPVKWLRWAWKAYLRDYPGGAEAAKMDPLCTPMAVAPNARPPATIIVTAEGDALYDDGLAVVKAFRSAGAEVHHVEGVGSHCLVVSKMYPEVEESTVSRWMELLGVCAVPNKANL